MWWDRPYLSNFERHSKQCIYCLSSHFFWDPSTCTIWICEHASLSSGNILSTISLVIVLSSFHLIHNYFWTVIWIFYNEDKQKITSLHLSFPYFPWLIPQTLNKGLTLWFCFLKYCRKFFLKSSFPSYSNFCHIFCSAPNLHEIVYLFIYFDTIFNILS